ncbi:MAG: hypothetical protein KGZ82_03755, partial [Bacteroidales bacterium]|nr:hypothetical protein [Bacteroidales bacterium]
MKPLNKEFMGALVTNGVFGGIILIHSLFIFTVSLKGQQATHFPFPIGTPGKMVSQILNFSTGDIGYFVAYSTEGLLVYRASDHTLINTVPFQNNEVHGRFSPLIFDRNLWPGTMNYMVYAENKSMLYVISPTLNIYRISALDLVSPGQGFGQVFINKPAELTGRIMDGSNSLKYDNLNNRLFWLCGVKSANNATGSFHIRANYFGIYDVNGENGYVQIAGIYVNSADNYTGTIFDFEYTRDYNLNYFKVFLAQKGNLKTIAYQKSNQIWTSTDLENKATLNGKFSKLLSFTYDGAQHIAAFPYRLPFEFAGGEPVEPPIGDQVSVTWFAASEPAETNSFPAPSKRITDACFDHTTNSVLVTFAPFDVDGTKDMYDNQLNGDGFGNDLYVYPISGNSAPYMVNNNGEGYGLRLDNMNYPTYFCNAGNALFLCKKDELVRLVYNASTQKFEQNRLIDARSAYFMGAIKAGSKYLILNILKNGVDVLNESFEQIDADAITFGKPVYHLAANNLNRTYYLYHNMLTENPGLYAVKMDDLSDFEDLSSLVDKPIGAVVCNPFNGDILISENDIREGGSGKIIVLNKENEQLTEIAIPGAINCTDMHVSPSGYVYVLSNAHGTSAAFVSTFNANDYTLIEEKLVEFPLEQGQDLKHYVSGYFEHNTASGHDYILLTDEEKSVEPYTTERYTTDGFTLNSTEIARDSAEYMTSEEQKIYMVANGNSIETFYTGSNLKDLVFIPAQADVGGDYNKLLVREGAKTIKIIDAVELTEKNSITMPGSVTYNPCIRFMSYDNERAKLYVLMDEANENAQPKAVSNRQFSVYEVGGLETMSPSVSRLFFTAGHAAAMTYNRYNRQLYVYYKGDNTKEAGTPAKLYAINPDLATNNYTSVSFPYLTMEPEVYFKKAELYPDPYTNQIIVLHGGHCNLSTVGFTPHETIPLKPNTVNWISFPRLRLEPGQNYATLDRALNNHPVLANQGNIQPETFFNAFEKDSYMKNNPSGALETSLINALWNEEVPDWEPEQPIGIFEIISDFGYKSEIISNEQIHQLHLAGTVESPAHEKFLYAATDPANPARRRENWTGYWLYETQDIFDALG